MNPIDRLEEAIINARIATRMTAEARPAVMPLEDAEELHRALTEPELSAEQITAGTVGSPVSHSIITPQCRSLRGDQGAWDEAVARAKTQYDAIIAGWRESAVQPTLHLVLGIERPDQKE